MSSAPQTTAGEQPQTVAQGPREANGNLQAAFARTATRTVALYYSRPIRLFRPSKVSGWQMLRGIASQNGAGLTPHFLSTLVKTQGYTVIAKHFIPPILVNTLLGTILFTTYTEVFNTLEHHIGHYPIITAAASGAVAGGVQALMAAPAENVRILIEGGTGYNSWSHAWKDVFRGTQARAPRSRKENVEDVREVRRWMKEVGEMAGRGWKGWGWTCAKDVCGFAAFFSVFSTTRRIAAEARTMSQANLEKDSVLEEHGFRRHIPRVIHGFLLVTGGVLAGLGYEFTTRPWEHARQTVRHAHLHHIARPSEPLHSLPTIIIQKFREDWLSFFRGPMSTLHHDVTTSKGRRRLISSLRTLARVGPWGVSFLAWEIFGPTAESTLDD